MVAYSGDTAWTDDLIGLAEAFSIGYISSTFSDAVVFAILIAVMLVRPSGLLGKAAVTKV